MLPMVILSMPCFFFFFFFWDDPIPHVSSIAICSSLKQLEDFLPKTVSHFTRCLERIDRRGRKWRTIPETSMDLHHGWLMILFQFSSRFFRRLPGGFWCRWLLAIVLAIHSSPFLNCSREKVIWEHFPLWKGFRRVPYATPDIIISCTGKYVQVLSSFPYPRQFHKD